MKALSQQFKARRLALGLTQAETAERARLSRKTLSDFENGKAAISLSNLERLVGAVGLELTFRERSPRPTLDELPARYGGPEPDAAPTRQRARKPRR